MMTGMHCLSEPCQNGGSCYEVFADLSYYCSCRRGFYGATCDQGTLCVFILVTDLFIKNAHMTNVHALLYDEIMY